MPVKGTVMQPTIIMRVSLGAVRFDDGCFIPHFKDWAPGSRVTSNTVKLPNGACDHVDIEIEPESAPLTVESILAAHAEPDEPVSKDDVERARVPPPVKVDLSTSPAYLKNIAEVPVENRFDGNLTSEEVAELVAAQHESRTLAGDSGRPVNPFSADFDYSDRPDANEFQKQPRHGNKPTSAFDW